MKKSTTALLAITSCLLWGSVFPVVKTMMTELHIVSNTPAKITLAGMRFSVAGLVILVLYTILNRKLPIPRAKSFGRLTIIGLFHTFFMYGFYYLAIAYVAGVKASVISQSGVFYIIILAYLFLGERVRRSQSIGLLFGLLGILAINLSNLGNTGDLLNFTFQGEGMLLLSGLFGSIAQIIGKKTTSSVPPMMLNGWQMTIGGTLLLISGILMNGGLVSLTSPLIISLWIYSIIVAAGAFTIWYTLLKHVDINEINPYRLTIPVFGSISSAIFLPGESIGVNIILGLAFVLVGMYFTSKPVKRR